MLRSPVNSYCDYKYIQLNLFVQLHVVWDIYTKVDSEEFLDNETI